jgi:hypothetical protein
MVPLADVAAPVRPETRTYLRPFLHKQITVKGIFRRFGSKPETARIDEVHHEGVCFCSHLWLQKANALRDHPLQPGDWVQFEATVHEYRKKDPDALPGEWEYTDYGLKFPRNVEVLEARPRPEAEAQPAPVVVAEPEPEAAEAQPEPIDLRLSPPEFKALKKLVEQYGGVRRLTELLRLFFEA